MMMMSTFIVNIWQLRQNNIITSVAVNYMKGIFCKKRQLMCIFGDKMENFIPLTICKMKWSDL